MGIFSSKKKIYVDSVTYNLSGDYVDRMNYLPTVTVGAALGSGSSAYIGESNTKSLINGPYKNQISLLKWARNHYAEAIPRAVLGGDTILNSPNILTYLTEKYGGVIIPKNSTAALTDITFWGKQYALKTYGEISDDDWVADIYESDSNKITKMSFIYKDTTTVIVDIDDCYKNTLYAYLQYYTTIPQEIDKTDSDGNVLLDANGNAIKETIYVNDKLYLDIYKFGSGNYLLDSIRPSENERSKSFMPFMPIRINNKFISDMPHNQYYDKVKKYYKKATGKKLDNFIKQLSENKNLKDIDYAYVVYGVAINTKRTSCKKYLFEFFDYLHSLEGKLKESFSEWKTKVEKNNHAIEVLYENKNTSGSKNKTSEEILAEMELYKDIGVSSEPPANYLDLSTNWLSNDYRLTLQWSGVSTSILSGKDNPKKTVGEIWVENSGGISLSKRLENIFGDNRAIKIKHVVKEKVNTGEHSTTTKTKIETETLNVPIFTIYKQVSKDHAICYDVLGLAQTNHVYKGKVVSIDSNTAMNDKDECSLLVPMHLNVLKKLSLKHRCQVCTENMYIIFNCYVVKKIKWYQKGIFKILIGIVLAIASVIFAPAGTLGIGILGSNLAIGSALGIGTSVMVTAIVGAVVNTIAAMVISTILTNVLGKLFKGTFGAIFGAIFGLLMGSIGSLFNGMNITTFLGQIFNPKNILNLTQAVMKAVGGIMQNSMQNMQQKMQNMTDEYTRKTDEVNQKMAALKGTNGIIDTSVLSSGTSDNIILNESRDTFLQRTLLTLCDIAELDKAHITSTIETTQELPQAFA